MSRHVNALLDRRTIANLLLDGFGHDLGTVIVTTVTTTASMRTTALGRAVHSFVNNVGHGVASFIVLAGNADGFIHSLVLLNVNQLDGLVTIRLLFTMAS